MSKALHHGNQTWWFGGRSGWEQALDSAQDHAEAGRAIIADALRDGSEEADALAKLDAFLFINWITIIAEQVKLGTRKRETVGDVSTVANQKGRERNHEKTAAEMLRSVAALDTMRLFLETNRYLWQAAYDGLEIASDYGEVLGASDGDMLFFYGELVRLDPGFQSFEYSPGEVSALSREPAMARFCKQFAHLHRPLPDSKES